MLEFLFWTCSFLVFYNYVVYPVLICILLGRESMPPALPDDLAEWPLVSLLIARHNEETVIESRIPECAGDG